MKLTIKKDDQLLASRPELAPMLRNFQDNLPELARGRENFGKRQSQFMDNLLTLSKPTPLRNMRQILSEVENTYGALQHSYFDQRKAKVEVQILYRDAELESDELKRELLLIEAERKQRELEESEVYISGSIRKLENYVQQYNNIRTKLMQEQGVEEFTEVDFEKEEEKYHIMTAFSQGLNAARARGGLVDEGNQIYFQQLGINGHVAQNEISRLLVTERTLLEQGTEPSNQLVLQFLEDMANKFEGCSKEITEHRGLTSFTASATVHPRLENK